MLRPTFLKTWARFKSTRKFVDPKAADSMPVFQYASQKDKVHSRVYVWGLAEHGALGERQFLKPTREGRWPIQYMHRPYRLALGEDHEIKDASCGYGFSVFVAKSSKGRSLVFGTGLNSDSQIGYHEVRKGKPLDMIVEPIPIHLGATTSKVQKASCGRAHTLLLTEDGSVLSLGHNGYGQCGRPIVEDEDYRRRATVHAIEVEAKISRISCGQDHSLFISDQGSLYACGWSADGQTGLGHYDNASRVAQCVGDVRGVNVVKVACGADCVLALSDEGDVFGFGNSEYGQLRLAGVETQQVHTARHLPLAPSVYGRIVDVAATGTACAVLNDSGRVFVWGYGVLGKGPAVGHSDEPTEIPATLFGRNEFNPDTKVVAIGAGIGQWSAITDRGDLYVWGRNRCGSLGLGHLKDQFFPIKVAIPGFVQKVSIGVDHCVALSRSYV